MFFDVQTLFWGKSPYQSLSNFASVAATATLTTSMTINLGVAEDLGIGQGEAQPCIALYVGTGITSASTSMTINWQFLGSTDSTTWTVYAETGALTTASFAAGANIFPIDVPKRPAGAALPQYYQMRGVIAGTDGTATISTGTVMGGIIVGGRNDMSDTLGLYTSGFTVV